MLNQVQHDESGHFISSLRSNPDTLNIIIIHILIIAKQPVGEAIRNKAFLPELCPPYPGLNSGLVLRAKTRLDCLRKSHEFTGTAAPEPENETDKKPTNETK